MKHYRAEVETILQLGVDFLRAQPHFYYFILINVTVEDFS